MDQIWPWLLVPAAIAGGWLHGVVVDRWRSREWIGEPTEPLPIVEDSLARHFDEAERLLRGECDPDIAALFKRDNTR